jgi:hypothetical protein
MISERGSQRVFFAISALLFAASAAATIVWCASMSAMGGMPMPGGWTMSMAWIPTNLSVTGGNRTDGTAPECKYRCRTSGLTRRRIRPG